MKKYYEKVFKIEGYDNDFRFKNIKPTKLLSLSTLFADKSDIHSLEQLFDFALLSTEVQVFDKWEPVLTILPTGEMSYWPVNIEDNISAITQIINIFIRDVLNKVFTKSNKSEK